LGATLHGSVIERGLADGAAGAHVGDVLDYAVADGQLDGHFVATERVVAFLRGGGLLEMATVARAAVVVKDYVAVQLVELRFLLAVVVLVTHVWLRAARFL
jgi:hypothetical protein